jgi:hypothetical protein
MLAAVVSVYVKGTKYIMTSIYCTFFNKIFDSGILPENWFIGTIMPIYKNNGSQLDPANFRPITILSCLGKILTAVLNERITVFLKKY